MSEKVEIRVEARITRQYNQCFEIPESEYAKICEIEDSDLSIYARERAIEKILFANGFEYDEFYSDEDESEDIEVTLEDNE
ncbi:hypothetical protein [Xenorhabdus bovienii]|uniref:Uncharacterized protein n=1 Tax=Xenorhabdus bovienii (strain SS-2004) TaxID=406818 RepID=D3V020_XENBS|nr:hypothetical protein [Xenorhabdus bovienii]MDE9455425.1 hypothetical protein [Xenorhabdus bovienii]MDE9545405.1 hypothetical protein [Xenorhabdus bovienii]CBJ80313.1 hypothetical protein XBJ1_1179 [Xenorhabdus bovienii SS-2004]CDH30045.1 hypothetical protein XBJ2_500020 [Xenorhabdus bovienii str. Jollieti]